MKQTDNRSRTLQSPELSAAQGYEKAQIVIRSLKKCRDDGSFTTFWEFVVKRTENVDVEGPILPLRRKAPKHMEEYFGYGSRRGHEPESEVELYRPIYFDAYDCAINAITDRFNHPDFKKYIRLQEL